MYYRFLIIKFVVHLRLFFEVKCFLKTVMLLLYNMIVITLPSVLNLILYIFTIQELFVKQKESFYS